METGIRKTHKTKFCLILPIYIFKDELRGMMLAKLGWLCVCLRVRCVVYTWNKLPYYHVVSCTKHLNKINFKFKRPYVLTIASSRPSLKC